MLQLCVYHCLAKWQLSYYNYRNVIKQVAVYVPRSFNKVLPLVQTKFPMVRREYDLKKSSYNVIL